MPQPNRPTSDAAAPVAEPVASFEAAYLDYVRAVFKAYSECQKRGAETYQNYARELNETQADLQKSGEDLQRNYVAAMQEAFGREDAQPRAEKAYRDYATQLQQAQEDAQHRLESLGKKLQDLWKQHTEDLQKRYAEALKQYVVSFQAAVKQLDPAQLRQADLTALSQSLTGVAYYAALTQTLKK